MFYVWAAFALAGLAKPAWNWFRRQRAGGWPIAEGRIESVEVNKPTFSFTTKRVEKVEPVDEEFYSYPHNLTNLLFAHVSAHPEQFGTLPKPDDA